MARLPIVVCAVFAAAGCATQGAQTAQVPAAPPASVTGSQCEADRPYLDGSELAVLWIRTSAEFRSAAEGTYRTALQALRQGLADREWSAEPFQSGDSSALPPAVIMDIDDTVLDNSEAQRRAALKDPCTPAFPAIWDAWVAERAAPAVPGAVNFIRAARELQDPEGRPVHVFFITNRECAARAGSDSSCAQKSDTLANLRELGLDTPTLDSDLMLRSERPEWVAEKLSRRRQVAARYRIVLNLGDDLADFIPEVREQTPSERELARCRHRDWWGSRWFVIPNPMYGSWQRVLGQDLLAALKRPQPAECGDAN